MVTKGGGDPKDFAIAGTGGKWVWADATIHGDTIITSSTSVSNPTRIRNIWSDNPVFNLFNSDGLPAAHFTTENDDAVVPVGCIRKTDRPISIATLCPVNDESIDGFNPLGRCIDSETPLSHQLILSKYQHIVLFNHGYKEACPFNK